MKLSFILWKTWFSNQARIYDGVGPNIRPHDLHTDKKTQVKMVGFKLKSRIPGYLPPSVNGLKLTYVQVIFCTFRP